MEFKLVENPFIPGYFRNGTAGCIGLNNGSNQGFRLIYGWQQLYPQNQFHMTNINHFIKNENEPPKRWLAGADAIETAEQKVKEFLQQFNAYRDLSSSLAIE